MHNKEKRILDQLRIKEGKNLPIHGINNYTTKVVSRIKTPSSMKGKALSNGGELDIIIHGTDSIKRRSQLKADAIRKVDTIQENTIKRLDARRQILDNDIWTEWFNLPTRQKNKYKNYDDYKDKRMGELLK